MRRYLRTNVLGPEWVDLGFIVEDGLPRAYGLPRRFRFMDPPPYDDSTWAPVETHPCWSPPSIWPAEWPRPDEPWLANVRRTISGVDIP